MNYLVIALCIGGSLGAQGGLPQFRQRQQKDRVHLIETIKWQNTLLTAPTYPVGVYKKDLVHAGFFACFVAADMLLYNQLMKWLVDKTTQAVTQDLDGLIAVLERTRAAERRFEERMAFATYQGDTALKVAAKKQILAHPLRRYLDTHHRFDPLVHKKTLSALGLRWAWDRLSCMGERAIVVPPPSLVAQLLGLELDDELRAAHEQAYLQGDDLVPAATAPYSATIAVKIAAFIMSPFIALRASLRNGQTSLGVRRLGVLNAFLGTRVPRWLFSQAAQYPSPQIPLNAVKAYQAPVR